MIHITLLSILFVIVLNFIALSQEENSWEIDKPILTPGKAGSFDETGVKDPSILYFNNNWHLFYTARSKTDYTAGYVSAKKLKGIDTAKRHKLKTIRGNTPYGCAPQVFYFEPHRLWYLIFQNRDSNYQPAFSTNPSIEKPDLWSKSKNIIEKDTEKKWIDFWIIANEDRVFMFYTEAHKGLALRSTSIKAFPSGWGKSKLVFDNIHEAVHVYKVKGKNEFHMVYELNKQGIRSFGMAKAKHLEGPWIKVTDKYATGKQLKYKNNRTPWTEMVSHGEVIRSGYDQKMEYEPENSRWVIQGILKKELNKKYEMLPWQLGIITKTAVSKSQNINK